MNRLAEYLELRTDVKCAEDALSDLKRQLSHAEQELIEEWSMSGIQNISVNGEVVYRTTDIGVSTPSENRKTLLGVVEKAVLVHLVSEPSPSVQPAKLRSYISECIRNEEPIIPEVRELILIHEQPRLRVRKS